VSGRFFSLDPILEFKQGKDLCDLSKMKDLERYHCLNEGSNIRPRNNYSGLALENHSLTLKFDNTGFFIGLGK
jgi:hypothetical protein